jgi:hypothetical protein
VRFGPLVACVKAKSNKDINIALYLHLLHRFQGQTSVRAARVHLAADKLLETLIIEQLFRL